MKTPLKRPVFIALGDDAAGIPRSLMVYAAKRRLAILKGEIRDDSEHTL